MRKIKVAATQMSCTWDLEATLKKAEDMVRDAKKQGANIVLLQELFETPYFCQTESYEYLNIATSVEDNRAVNHFKEIAKELEIVIPISFFERAGNTTFNSLVVIDADGSVMDTYRKTHIPDGHCYEEKFYFTPGDTGFKVWDTAYGRIGVGICWDQWFPESARIMALMGAEILFYPTAIGSEPILPIDSQPHWQRCMQGHAAANIIPLVASNRVGTEVQDESSMTFYGSSFIAGPTGEIVKQMDRDKEGVIVVEFDLDEIREKRQSWGIYRDRRPEMYKSILSH
ncbi:N-carbamoylputrescine amidase [Clostridium butyricum]|jgi:N-carbamoylputrescine amidase|uniref:N-carbamoylputrescine amidase n=1 Tax=Clostridium butyricum TaxID=1492 RepID=A0A2S7F8M9_CLOBU|nr:MULTISPECIES: N-carbamoylputrescine amidase [Clostridium]APF22968.1 N-carbamoylputrescine amidase [Clostridium butyricum]EMU54070.1 N-carbamoylputrescine amidase [Clostridium butyricum DKU-01]KHD16673.1 carbon-nitrogen hydrolase [Clostridium butyricum]MBZ0311460.1 N-carbamoylputrescine amidase [Clostridium butyricum]MDU0321111.1 N-carbamoylputrescine amidase [Clostridium butyricum]